MRNHGNNQECNGRLPMKRYIALFMTFTFILLLVSFVNADELSVLKEELRKIKSENEVLRERLSKGENTIESLIERIEAIENKKEETTSVLPVIEEPRLSIRGFSDISLNVDNGEDENRGDSSFALGQFDLFITSKISDNVNFLSEIVLEADSDNEIEVDLERLQLKYSYSDLLNVTVGRIHTALGYWLTTYHHGAWLQTTTFRPEIYRWEDEGGVLPSHLVGLQLSGRKDYDIFDIGYALGVANGRGRTTEEIQMVRDRNDSKAVNLLLTISPTSIDGLEFGVSAYMDTIPPDEGSSARVREIDELIMGGYIAYIHDRVELLGEFFDISHEDKTSSMDFETTGFYIQGAYKIDKFKPYFRFDSLDFGEGDPFFTSLEEDIRKDTLGIRWDYTAFSAIKLEYSFTDRDIKNDFNSFAINVSFTF
jgi:hypothetical protein